MTRPSDPGLMAARLLADSRTRSGGISCHPLSRRAIVTPMSTAQETRANAINRVIDACFDGQGNLIEDDNDESRTAIAQSIMSLRGLGRSARWHDAIETWHAMVLDETHPLHHALLQGAIDCGHQHIVK